MSRCKHGSTAAKGPRPQACLKSNLFVQSNSQLADFPKEVGKKGYLYLAGRDGQARSRRRVPSKQSSQLGWEVGMLSKVLSPP